MRQASVGFQCPECVNEGARTTRSGRSTYGGGRSRNPALTSQVLIGINVAVWLLILVTGGTVSPWLYRLALLPVQGTAAIHGQLETFHGVADGAFWQPLTSMFVQVQILHIGFNMLALWVLGPQLEVALGRARFLAVYLLSGLTGSAFVYWLTPIHVPTLGASGAVFGLMGALLVLALKVRADVSQLLVWIGINFVLTVVGRGFISWEGHLGGFIGGVVLASVIAWAPRSRRTMWQWLAIGSYIVLLIVAFGTRTTYLT
jgi:membrane associated rhomboid family serine protease